MGGDSPAGGFEQLVDGGGPLGVGVLGGGEVAPVEEAQGAQMIAQDRDAGAVS